MIVAKSHEQFKDAVRDGLVFAYFTATWCGPCKAGSPVFEQLQNVTLVKVDADEGDEIFERYGISCIPTIQVWKSGALVETVEGCPAKKLVEVYQTHTSR